MGSTKEWDDFNHNHTKYEPQLVYHEPQLEKFEIIVNHILESRRPIKIYKMDQKTWMDTLHVFNPFLGGKTKSQLERYVGTISRTL
jgi:hypothetical protein